eukprot:1905539-Prymnesium_polylepis.1
MHHLHLSSPPCLLRPQLPAYPIYQHTAHHASLIRGRPADRPDRLSDQPSDLNIGPTRPTNRVRSCHVTCSTKSPPPDCPAPAPQSSPHHKSVLTEPKRMYDAQ